jgi:dipeptidyl aminopeptidase/acylaminoacyl peptidase
MGGKFFGGVLSFAFAVVATPASAATDPLAIAFGARPTIIDASLSPDGTKIALVAADIGQKSQVLIFDTIKGGDPVRILASTAKPEKLSWCSWISNTRLACRIYGQIKPSTEILGFTSLVAIDSDGKNARSLELKRGANALGYDFRGARIVDLLPAEDGSVLLARSYVEEEGVDTNVKQRDSGLGIDRVNTLTGKTDKIIRAKPDAMDYLSDGLGTVRLMMDSMRNDDGFSLGRYRTFFRRQGSTEWEKLGEFDSKSRTGFWPLAMDPVTDRAVGTRRIDGREAIVAVKLDGSGAEDVLFKHDRYDVSDVVTLGRKRSVVGASYVGEYRTNYYFDQAIRTLIDRLSKALGGIQLGIAETDIDQNRLLLASGSDTDPGKLYLFDRKTKQLSPVVEARATLAGRTLSPTNAVSYPATDGTMIPAYLTLPPGTTQAAAKGLPAIVMPHGGPESRDDGGFDWLVQFFAAKGFAVLQPNFRGSSGYGDAWFVKNGFQSWDVAIGDVTAGGRWLVSQGIAAPAKLTIAGWSYGGYAALQSAVVAPDLFKAVVAIAPVTDLGALVNDRRDWGDFLEVQRYVGSGPHVRAGSPALNVDKITAPVLLFHGTMDSNVDVRQSRIMQSRMDAAGKPSELVIFDGLDHQLDDSTARADMLEKSAAFLLKAGQ